MPVNHQLTYDQAFFFVFPFKRNTSYIRLKEVTEEQIRLE